MTPALADFARAFVFTAVGVALTALLGRLARRRAHVTAAVMTLAVFLWTVYLAEVLGRTLVIPRYVLIIHLTFANLATVALLAVIVTGTRLLRSEAAARRRWHRRMIAAFVVLLLAATATGVWMITRSTSRIAPETRMPGAGQHGNQR